MFNWVLNTPLKKYYHALYKLISINGDAIRGNGRSAFKYILHGFARLDKCRAISEKTDAQNFPEKITVARNY